MPWTYSLQPSSPQALDPARVTLATPPAVEPWLVTDDAVQQHLHLEVAADAAYVTLILAAARRHFEMTTGLALINQTLRATFDRVPLYRELELPRAPLVTVDALSYLDDDAVTTVFNLSNVKTVNAGAPGAFGRVVLNPAASWPSLGDYRGAFAVDFTAGFGSAATDIPDDIRLALLWLAAWWYEERQPVNVGNSVNPLPAHLESILAAHRVAFLA